ncbi:MAG: hypothetical protein EOM18_17120 [Clostridia bacterium]|nr:hypothetical protein [Clostridia bacterium]
MTLPIAFEREMKRLLGNDFQDFLDSYDHQPNSGLRVNTRKIAAKYFEKISPFSIEPVEWIPNGYTYQNEIPSKDPYPELFMTV